MANGHAFLFHLTRCSMENSVFELLTVKELPQKLKVPESWVYGETRKTGPGTIPRINCDKVMNHAGGHRSRFSSSRLAEARQQYLG